MPLPPWSTTCGKPAFVVIPNWWKGSWLFCRKGPWAMKYLALISLWLWNSFEKFIKLFTPFATFLMCASLTSFKSTIKRKKIFIKYHYIDQQYYWKQNKNLTTDSIKILKIVTISWFYNLENTAVYFFVTLPIL